MADAPKTETPAAPVYTAQVSDQTTPPWGDVQGTPYVVAQVSKDGQPWRQFTAENRRKLSNAVKSAVKIDKAGGSPDTITIDV